jgi:pyridinium-3,5-biscarboxylic acid mononucleotide sulfurtransferase
VTESKEKDGMNGAVSNKTLEKLAKLKQKIGAFKSAVIAFSGGVDSTFLARVSRDVLGEHALLVTATSSTYPYYELEEAKKLAEMLGMKQRVIVSEEIDIPGFSDNPPDRCYYCKNELFSLIRHIAGQEGFEAVFDGSNADDLKDYRPGMKALREQGVLSPLREAGLTKQEIRQLSGQMGLPTADKPTYACLASRFPYGERITREKLQRVGMVEKALRDLGFTQIRVRSHGDLARIELTGQEMERGWVSRQTISDLCHKAGFVYAAIDLDGYRTGAMNEVLSELDRGDDSPKR